ncbi:BCCT family transporter [Schaalia sp. Marseille-Q2122]|uniref:BCCT family transporter n=1 Tax=Schaalia sp. Marseille-Q2122 TaxID=2736604 RepID=UPI001C37D219|nr:BCCT family transporter [Schaalia sp. Marseille-Q2122]
MTLPREENSTPCEHREPTTEAPPSGSLPRIEVVSADTTPTPEELAAQHSAEAPNALDAISATTPDAGLVEQNVPEHNLHFGPEITLPEDPASVARVVAELEAAHSDAALVTEHEAAMATIAAADDEVGTVSWRVMLPALLIAVALIAPAILVPDAMKDVVNAISLGLIHSLGWYYSLIVVGFVIYVIVIATSRYGDITLGADDDEPAYSRASWFAMLFAAGMGIGLVFFGVSEPLSHYVSPPPGTSAGTQAQLAQNAMDTTFLHWGLSAWAIYTVVGLSVAYMSHRKGRSVSIRWVLEPLLGDRVRGWVGDLIDIAAVLGTLFGVAASLGFGAVQFTAGMEYLGVLTSTPVVLLLVVIGVTSLAALSVASGLDKGIKILSNSNLILGIILLLAVLLLGQPLFVLREFVQSLGQYIQQFIPLSFRTMPFLGEEGQAWLSSWTVYYWGWWMSWSPFVGIFIARISRGRTIREFIVGVLAVPTLVTFLWFSVMGGTALWQQMNGVDLTANEGWSTTALFTMLEQLPGGPVLSGLFILLLVVFFVTSADSASFVLGMLSSGGSSQPPLGVRLVWAAMEGTIAATLLWVGASTGHATDGLTALQVLAVMTALPFSVVMVLSCVSMFKAFHEEQRLRDAAERQLVRERVNAMIDHAVATPRRPREWMPSVPLYTAPRRRK